MDLEFSPVSLRLLPSAQLATALCVIYYICRTPPLSSQLQNAPSLILGRSRSRSAETKLQYMMRQRQGWTENQSSKRPLPEALDLYNLELIEYRSKAQYFSTPKCSNPIRLLNRGRFLAAVATPSFFACGDVAEFLGPFPRSKFPNHPTRGGIHIRRPHRKRVQPKRDNSTDRLCECDSDG